MISILYGTGPGFQTLEVDATMTQVAKRSVKATRFPIETGAEVTDHAIREPAAYQLTGVLTNTPAQSIPGDVTQMTGEEIDASIPWSPQRADDARAALEALVGYRVTVDTGPKVFTDYLVESVEFPKDGATGDAVIFQASLTEILTVSSQVVAVPAAKGGSKVDQGKKATTTATPSVQRKKSMAAAGADWVMDQAKKFGIGGNTPALPGSGG